MTFTKIVGVTIVSVLLLSFWQSWAHSTRGGEAMSGQGWWSARRDSAGVAPNPVRWRDTAIVQVYAAPTYGWRGLVAVHPWIILKAKGETRYRRYEVISWGSVNVVRLNYTLPDGFWYGATPQLLVEHRGEAAQTMIPQIDAAIKSYPWPQTYRAWPGPNSNTFLAHIGREVPALKLDMPANAIGKDYRSIVNPLGLAPSGSGVQISVLGALGVTLALEEGLEVNLLGMNLGIDVNPPALRLPFIGRLGFDNVDQQQER